MLCQLSIAALLAISLIVPVPAGAVESEGAIDPGKLAKRLQGIPFGGDLDALMKHVAAKLEREYAARREATQDIAARDRLTAEVGVRLQAIRDSYVEFAGQKTGYNVSVVSEEFAHNTSEAMVVAPAGRSHDYFFFIKGELYKVVTTETTQRSLATYLVNLTQVFGKPARVDYEDPERKTDPIAARWESPELLLEVAARPDYGAITLRFTQRAVHDKLAELRGGAKPPAETAGEGLDPTILDIMKE